MYRDDPLADEQELRAIAGDRAVDELLAYADHGLLTGFDVAVEVLRVLQGWVDDDEAGDWFRTPQARLDGRTPVSALVDGDVDEVRDAASSWAAAQA